MSGLLLQMLMLLTGLGGGGVLNVVREPLIRWWCRSLPDFNSGPELGAWLARDRLHGNASEPHTLLVERMRTVQERDRERIGFITIIRPRISGPMCPQGRAGAKGSTRLDPKY